MRYSLRVRLHARVQLSCGCRLSDRISNEHRNLSFLCENRAYDPNTLNYLSRCTIIIKTKIKSHCCVLFLISKIINFFFSLSFLVFDFNHGFFSLVPALQQVNAARNKVELTAEAVVSGVSI